MRIFPTASIFETDNGLYTPKATAVVLVEHEQRRHSADAENGSVNNSKVIVMRVLFFIASRLYMSMFRDKGVFPFHWQVSNLRCNVALPI